MANVKPLTSGELQSKVLQVPGPVVLDFFQATCPPCRALEPRLEKVAEDYADRVAVYRVDIDQGPALTERFGVDSLPTVVIVRGGQEVERLDGLITEQQLREALERASHA